MRNTIFSYKSYSRNSFLALFMCSEVKVKVKCHLSAVAKADLVSGAFVCWHGQGSWNAISSDQFGEQTAIKIGSAFPIGACICDTVDLLYEEDQPNEKEVLHKEEGLSRRHLMIGVEYPTSSANIPIHWRAKVKIMSCTILSMAKLLHLQ